MQITGFFSVCWSKQKPKSSYRQRKPILPCEMKSWKNSLDQPTKLLWLKRIITKQLKIQVWWFSAEVIIQWMFLFRNVLLLWLFLHFQKTIKSRQDKQILSMASSFSMFLNQQLVLKEHRQLWSTTWDPDCNLPGRQHQMGRTGEVCGDPLLYTGFSFTSNNNLIWWHKYSCHTHMYAILAISTHQQFAGNLSLEEQTDF